MIKYEKISQLTIDINIYAGNFKCEELLPETTLFSELNSHESLLELNIGISENSEVQKVLLTSEISSIQK
jgi:hypothetical protein